MIGFRYSYMAWMVFPYVALVAGRSEARPLKEIVATGELRGCIANVEGVAKVIPDRCTENCTGGSGAAPESLAVFSRELGVKLKIIGVEWDQQFWNANKKTEQGASYTPELLKTGKCDVYGAHLARVEWREKLIAFSILFPSRMMVVVNREFRDKIKSEEDLAGKKIAVEKNTSAYDWVEAQNKGRFANRRIQVVIVGPNESFKYVSEKKADFALGGADISFYNTSKIFKNTMVTFPVGPMGEIGWAVRKDDGDLQKRITDFFEKSRNDRNSQMNKIWQQNYNLSLWEFSSVASAVK